jgi:hypothetical protein
MNLTLTREALAGTVDAYARAQESALAAQRVPGYRHIGTAPIAGREGVVTDRELHDGKKRSLAQRQAFMKVGATVVVITGTGPSSEQGAVRAAVDAVVSSLEAGATP